LWVGTLFAAACADPQLVGSDCQVDSGVCTTTLSRGRRAGGNSMADPGPQDAGGPVRSGRIARLDLLLVVDRSASMREERAAFAEQLAPLLGALVQGDVDGAGEPEFLGVTDLRVSMVSSDLGAGTASGTCTRGGDMAQRLLAQDSADGLAPSCKAAPDGFLSLEGPGGVDALAQELACRLLRPEEGCRIEQPLAAAVSALEREHDMTTGLRDAGGEALFLRPDSLLVVLVLADEDDCSSDEPDALLTGDRSRTACSDRVDLLRRVDALSSAILDLRATASDLALLAVVTGVPVDRVDVGARLRHGMESPAGREAFYAELLADPRMQPVADAAGSEAAEDQVGLAAACQSDAQIGYPSPRLVQAVRNFGARGVVQSLCDPNAWQLIAHTIGRRLGSPER
jgi:hypothetical protein